MSLAATAAKIISAASKSDKGQNIIKSIIAIILGIVILIVGTLFTIIDSLSNGACDILSLLFGNIDIPNDCADDLFLYLTETKENFTILETQVSIINEQLGEDKLDATWVKAVYYAIDFEHKIDSIHIYSFARCFVGTQWDDEDEINVYYIKTDNNILFSDVGEMINYYCTDETIDYALEVFNEVIFINHFSAD